MPNFVVNLLKVLSKVILGNIFGNLFKVNLYDKTLKLILKE